MSAELAESWLKDPALLGYLEDAICAEGSEKPLLGESDNAIQLMLTLLGKGSLEVRGLTAAGKNTLVDHVLGIFPPERWKKVGGLTDKSLRYLDEEANIRILYVTERRGLGREKDETTAEYDVKVGISEGEITVGVTERDKETNRMVTVFRKVSIESFIFTTTEVEAPPELENRLTILNVHDDVEQNRLVRDSQLEGAKRFPWQKRDYAEKRATAALALAEVLDSEASVIIPYAEVLKPILSVESSIVRRNTPKILDLVRSCAKLYQRQRVRIPGPWGGGDAGIVAGPEDLALVLYTGQRSLSAILSAIPEKVSVVLEVCKRVAVSKVDLTTSNIWLNGTAEEKTRLGSLRTVQRSFRALIERGVLVPTGEKSGRNPIYTLENGTTPLVIDIPELLRAAEAEYSAYVSSVSSVVEQTGSVLGDRERQTPKVGDSRPVSPISSSDSLTTSDSQDTKEPLSCPPWLPSSEWGRLSEAERAETWRRGQP